MAGKFGPHINDGTATLTRAGTSAIPPLAVVRVLNVPSSPPVFRLGLERCRIGSGPGCDLVVQEPTVSRAHVELAIVEGGVLVEDLGSRNGTFYLGQRVQKLIVALGSRLRIGSATLAIDVDADALQGEDYYEGDSYRGVIGPSAPMKRIFGLLSRLEKSRSSVLVEGESGVGKEVIAAAVHEGSGAKGPLITLNCGAMPRDLIGSELFGHMKGAFTGATDSRRGAFELAHEGTLFLDEIGELPVDLQPVLLRVLETGEVRPIGGDRPKQVNVRILTATNRDLEAEMRAGRFREDLFFRLAVVRLKVPPLRDRREDIEPLARHFSERFGISQLPQHVIEDLRGRSWPGNVRELRNTLEAYAALGTLPDFHRSSKATLDFALREFADPGAAYADQKEALVERFTAIYLKELLDKCGGNQTAAARLAGLDRGYLGRLAAKYRTKDSKD